jgi:hypothetical protein
VGERPVTHTPQPTTAQGPVSSFIIPGVPGSRIPGSVFGSTWMRYGSASVDP